MGSLFGPMFTTMFYGFHSNYGGSPRKHHLLGVDNTIPRQLLEGKRIETIQG
jgi:hypothetical protein